MEVSDILSGVPWTLAVGIGLAVWRGDLRLRREVDAEIALREKVEAVNQELSTELKAVTAASQQALRDEQAATRQEMSELRRTNAQLVKTLTATGGTVAS